MLIAGEIAFGVPDVHRSIYVFYTMSILKDSLSHFCSFLTQFYSRPKEVWEHLDISVTHIICLSLRLLLVNREMRFGRVVFCFVVWVFLFLFRED